MNYLWFDTETSGKDAKKYHVLTAYFAICDSNHQIIDDLELQLKPDSGGIDFEQEALDVNGIDLNEHISDPNTITYSEGKTKILEFFEKNKVKGKRRSFIPCGHNFAFDENFIFSRVMSQEDWEQFVHYRRLDTSVICNFLKDVNVLPDDTGSLTSLVEHFKIPKGEAHNARGDVHMNIEVYKCMKGIMKAKKSDMISTSSSLLEIIEE